jgi:hypothetical protein
MPGNQLTGYTGDSRWHPKIEYEKIEPLFRPFIVMTKKRYQNRDPFYMNDDWC